MNPIHPPSLSLHFKKNIKHYAQLQISTLLVLIGFYTILILTLLISNNVRYLFSLWGKSLELIVYLKEDIQEDQIRKFEKTLLDTKKFDKIIYQSKNSAIEKMKLQFGQIAPEITKDPDLLQYIPSSYNLTLNENIPPETQAKTMLDIAQFISSQTIVDEVSYGEKFVQNFSKLSSTFNTVSYFFIALLTFASMIIVGALVKSSFLQRKSEVEIYELIGAPPFYIRKPYIMEGAYINLLTSSIACLLSYIIFLMLKKYLSENLVFATFFSEFHFLDIWTLIAFFSLSLFFGILSSLLSIRSINTGWAAAKFSAKGCFE